MQHIGKRTKFANQHLLVGPFDHRTSQNHSWGRNMGAGVGEAVTQISSAAASGLGFQLYLGCRNSEFKSTYDLSCSKGYLDLTCGHVACRDGARLGEGCWEQ